MASPAIENLTSNSVNRRETRRYAVESDVRYQLLDGVKVVGTGTGRTINISSGGILLKTPVPIPAGTRLQLFIAWPARLHGETSLQLCASGVVVRSEGLQSAIQIQRHEFRTRRIAA